MKSVRYWRLWHRLFGRDYAQVWTRDRKVGAVFRVRRLANGQRYIVWGDGTVYLFDDCKHKTPLTWVSENDTLHAFADLVQKQLQEE